MKSHRLGRNELMPPRYRRVRVKGTRKLVTEHRLVWTEHHGPIPDGMVIHHINGDRRDNRIENLQMMTPAAHRHLHAGYELRDGVWHKPCRMCGEIKPLTEFYRYPYFPYDGVIPYCKPCHRRKSRERQQKIRDQWRKPIATEEVLPGEPAHEGP